MTDILDFDFLDIEETSEEEVKISFEKPSFYSGANDKMKALIDDVIGKARDINRRLKAGEKLSTSEYKINKTQLAQEHGLNGAYISKSNRTDRVKELYFYIEDINAQLKSVADLKVDKASKSLENMTKPELIIFGKKARNTAKKAREIVMSAAFQEMLKSGQISKQYRLAQSNKDIIQQRDEYAIKVQKLEIETKRLHRELREAIAEINKLKNQLQTKGTLKSIDGGAND